MKWAEHWSARWAWHRNDFLSRRPGLLATMGIPLTVEDAFGTPGDTLLTATVCRNLKRRHPRLKINCITPNAELLRLEPAIDTLNRSPGVATARFWYLGISGEKDGRTHVLEPTLHMLGIRHIDKRARFYLTDAERDAAAARLEPLGKPVITLNTHSREKVKTWPAENWQELVDLLGNDYALVQLGANDEPELRGVVRLAGTLSMRESVALLSHAWLHIGCVSFLMHAANGVDIPAVIIYGGRETPANSGYAENENLYTKLDCSPCWLHDSHGDVCTFNVKCMTAIFPETVLERVKAVLARRKPPMRVWPSARRVLDPPP